MTLNIQKLDKKKHDRQAFDCGLTDVNKFLQDRARKHMDIRVSQTWVATQNVPGSMESYTPIDGYFTLTQGVVKREDLPSGSPSKKFPAYALPVIKLAWLGVDKKHRCSDARIGETLLLEALYKGSEIANFSGSGIAVVVDPLTDESDSFFRRYGFQGMELDFHGRQTLYLPMGTVAQLVGAG